MDYDIYVLHHTVRGKKHERVVTAKSPGELYVAVRRFRLDIGLDEPRTEPVFCGYAVEEMRTNLNPNDSVPIVGQPKPLPYCATCGADVYERDGEHDVHAWFQGCDCVPGDRVKVER